MMDKIRTLGFYQPFCSLMLHGKLETRFVREGKKPPFPLGKYLFYSTKIKMDDSALIDLAGLPNLRKMTAALLYDKSKFQNGFALGMGDLKEVKLLSSTDENTFVQWIGVKNELIKDQPIAKLQYGLYFENVQRIDPFEWLFGKQGVGFVPESELVKIKII